MGQIHNNPPGLVTTAMLTAALANYIPLTQKGAASGVAPLNGSSLIDSAYLPSYVDDVLEFVSLAGFPATGVTGKIYVALDTNYTYRWSGSTYVAVGGSGYVPTTRTITINGVTYDLSANRSWTITSGGTPGGSDTDMQFNNATAFGGADYHYNSTTHRLGGQVSAANAIATLHLDNVTSETLSPPASLSYVLTADSAVDSPGSGSASQVDAPSDPTGYSFGFTYIDMPFDNMWFANQNTGGSGFTAYGQSFVWNIYAYRNSGSYKVVNPTPYTIYFNDSINDSSTPFQMDIGGWATANSYQDGFIITRYDTYTGSTYSIDIGNTTSYSDTGFTNTDSYTASTYAASSFSWTSYISQYKLVNSTNYRTAYISYSNTDSAYSNAYMIMNHSWGALVNDGFWLQSAANYYYNVGTATTFDDWGANTPGSVGDTSAWAASCFPGFDTSITDGSVLSGPTQNDGSGSYYANGTVSLTYKIVEYKQHPITNELYVSGGYTFSFGDNNDNNYFTVHVDLNAGSANRIWLVSYDGGSTYPYGADIGSATSFDDSGSNPTAPDVSRLLSSYSGITRNYSDVGYISSPSVKYSVSPSTYSFTDNNPLAGYMIRHTQGSPSVATGMKIIEVSTGRNGSVYWSGIINDWVQANSSVGDSVVTPATIGYEALGQSVPYKVYATKTINGTAIWSSTAGVADYASTTVVFPNTPGVYYVIDFTIATVSGATYKMNKSSIYQTTSSTSFQDNTTVGWGSSSSLTPIQALGPTAVFDFNYSTFAFAPVRIRNKNSGDINGWMEFQYNAGSSYAMGGKFGVVNSGNAAIDSYNGGLEVGTYNSPHTQLSLSQNTIFNKQASASYRTWIKGSTVSYLMYANSSNDTVYFGHQNGIFGDPQSAAYFEGVGSDAAMCISPTSGASDSGYLVKIENSSSTIWAGITNRGRGFFMTSSPGNGNFRIGAGDASYAPLVIDHSATLANVAGGFGQKSGQWYGANASNIMTRFVQSLATGTSGQFWYSDSNGYPTTSGAPIALTSSNTILDFAAAYAPLFRNGITVSSGKSISMGSSASYTGGFRTGFATASASTTLSVSNHSPIFVFTGSTSGRTLTLPTAASISGTIFEISNEASVSVTVATTSSQNLNIGLGTQTTLVLQPGDRAKFIATASNSWDVTNYQQWIYTVANGGTGITSYTTGDLLYASSSSALSKLASVAAGSYLRSGGTSTAPVWSTVTLPNTTTANQLLYSSATNIVSGLATANNGVLITNGSGVPSITNTLNGDFKLGTAGNGFYVKEGTNATMGVATLVAGTVTVNTTKVTASSRIFLSTQGGTLTNVAAVYVSARTAGTSFTITSTNVLDTSDVAWIIIETA